MSPLERWKRLIAMLPHHNIGEVEDSSLAWEIAPWRGRQCYRLSQCAEGQMGSASPQYDCANLAESTASMARLRVNSGTALLSYRFFIRVNKLRSGGMPTNCRLPIGRQGEKKTAPPGACTRVNKPCASALLRNQECEDSKAQRTALSSERCAAGQRLWS